MLKDTTIRHATAREKPYKLFDGGGLYLNITPSRGRWWRLKYHHEGRERLLSLGVCPQVSLKDARAKRDESRKLLAAGIDPSAHRRARKAARGGANSLEAVARRWNATCSPGSGPDLAARSRRLNSCRYSAALNPVVR